MLVSMPLLNSCHGIRGTQVPIAVSGFQRSVLVPDLVERQAVPRGHNGEGNKTVWSIRSLLSPVLSIFTSVISFTLQLKNCTVDIHLLSFLRRKNKTKQKDV